MRPLHSDQPGDERARRSEAEPSPPPSLDTPHPQSDLPDSPQLGNEEPKQPVKKVKAGRNLPAAIITGVVLGAVILGSLLIQPIVFLGVAGVAVAVGTWELATAMRKAGKNVPVVPLAVGAVIVLALTWFGGGNALMLSIGLVVAALFIWRLGEGATGYHIDLPASVLVAVYVPFLGGFAMLIASAEDGAWRVIAMLLMVVLSDTGGYVAGVFFGKHPMAPRISPKKSWEGLFGSVAASSLGGALALWLLFEVDVWMGLAVGVSIALAGTLGDLTESLIKRDLGIKDMSNLIPGHGGLMDRLDSILMAAPVAFIWFWYLLGLAGDLCLFESIDSSDLVTQRWEPGTCGGL
ncbi:phosphatidate cytidylyltransferase [Natronoglycomyces albus]|uniref:Phosphatidate cytidylyltransferase n=1 Tax=Natronoglycomyces albus TaxID=2811108 RepID=A0A895XR81_9ACTN|nr:phosphatidate cytidylyltransferase [Natronoglycomyces albus]QSB06222.1 phosphatidate cytidylyltransferase [Natronoglycomyces albus]